MPEKHSCILKTCVTLAVKMTAEGGVSTMTMRERLLEESLVTDATVPSVKPETVQRFSEIWRTISSELEGEDETNHETRRGK